MKKQSGKIISVLCFVFMLIALLIPAQAASFADVDGDGHIFAADARLVHRVYAGLSPQTPGMLADGDTDGDNMLTRADASLILLLAVGYGNAADSCIDGMAGAVLKGITANHYKIYEKDGITYIDGILIANKTYSLPADYNPGGLTAECLQAFNEMTYDAYYNDGVNLYELSGYRSFATQYGLYRNYVAADGKAMADTYSARPGHSEHQSGLALDVNSVENSFAYTAEAKWIAENCHKYGFILRYPDGKTDKTGYIYEPWHIRYVGKSIAAKIYASGLCLEEYYGITSQYES